jgi:hypothetical protein
MGWTCKSYGGTTKNVEKLPGNWPFGVNETGDRNRILGRWVVRIGGGCCVSGSCTVAEFGIW